MANEQTIINLYPVEMNAEIMQYLESKGLIIRLCPGHHELHAEEGTAVWDSIYESSEKYGSHKLITVTINADKFFNFGSHPDNEEFLLIGDPESKPLYLVICLCKKNELNEKIRNETLREEDFITLKVKYNDAEVSFFTMLKDVPHGEISSPGPGRPGTFYVTEPQKLFTEKTGFCSYDFNVV